MVTHWQDSYWEKHCHKAIVACGFQKVTGWECLYKNYSKQLFLSVYVDDFKMGGKQSSLAPAWKELCQHLDLEEPTKLDDQVYLGIKQERVIIPQEIVDEKAKLYQEIFEKKCSKDDQVSADDNKVKVPAKPKKKSKKSKARQKCLASSKTTVICQQSKTANSRVAV